MPRGNHQEIEHPPGVPHDQAEQLRLVMRQTRAPRPVPLSRAEGERWGASAPAGGLPSLSRSVGEGPGVRARQTRVIAVSSGKGGVGKTNVVVNLAVALGQAGRRVLLFDADLGLANVDVVMGIAPRYHLGHVISGEKRLDEIVVDGPANVRVVPGGSGVLQLANLSAQRRQEVIAALERLDGTADYLLIDTAAGVSEAVLSFVATADDALIVTTPEPTAITDAYALIKVTAQTAQRLPSFRLIVNQVRDQSEAEEVARKIIAVAQQFLGVTVRPEGYLPIDPAISRAVRRQVPIVLAYPNAPAALRLVNLSRRLDRPLTRRGTEPKSASVSGFFQRMIGFAVPKP
ncbi:MAG: MinD/ParA family protein [Chloroflexi bacterium]|nr:MinD/ParA family protein [Chloroflexota bacterium]